MNIQYVSRAGNSDCQGKVPAIALRYTGSANSPVSSDISRGWRAVMPGAEWLLTYTGQLRTARRLAARPPRIGYPDRPVRAARIGYPDRPAPAGSRFVTVATSF